VSERRAARGWAALVVLAVLVASGCGGARDDAAPSTAARAPVGVVRVVVGSGAARDVATGVVAGEGRVLTVAHALAPGAVVTVAPPGGAARRARVVRADRRLDAAVLAVAGVSGPALATADPTPGQHAAVVVVRGGARRSLAVTVRRRITARVHAQPGDTPLVRPALELAAAIEPGDSGAPVIDDAGRLIGLAFAASERPGVAYAVRGAAAIGVLRAER
jgi:S1-C subfamily serine protease